MNLKLAQHQNVFCEAIAMSNDRDKEKPCTNYATATREGRRVCYIHRLACDNKNRAKPVRFVERNDPK